MNNNCILAVSVPAKALLCFPHSHGIRRCCDGNEYKAIHIRLHANLNGRKFSFEMRYSVYNIITNSLNLHSAFHSCIVYAMYDKRKMVWQLTFMMNNIDKSKRSAT